MPLSRQSIRRRIEEDCDLVISHYEPKLVNPASVNLRLGVSFKTYRKLARGGLWVGRDHPEMVHTVYDWGDPVEIKSLEFMLATTYEIVTIPNDLVGQFTGRSGTGRYGLDVHATAGWIDPGFRGMITAELFNKNPNVLFMEVGLEAFQLELFEMDEAVDMGYIGSYQDQVGATESRLESNVWGASKLPERRS